MTTTPRTTQFAVVCTDRIYGVGATEAAARADAAEWMDGGDGGEVFPITDALAALVVARGGDVAFATVDGVLCTETEAEA